MLENIYTSTLDLFKSINKIMKTFLYGFFYLVSYSYKPEDPYSEDHKDFIDDVFNNDYQKIYGNILDFKKSQYKKNIVKEKLTHMPIYSNYGYNVQTSAKEHLLYLLLIFIFLMGILAILF